MATLAAAAALLVTIQPSAAVAYAASPVPQAADAQQATGLQVYGKYCAMCHGPNREGNPPAFPTLHGVGKRLTRAQIVAQIRNGKGNMPPFPNLTDAEVAAVVHYLDVSDLAAPPPATPPTAQAAATHPSPLVDAGSSLFQQNCAFCHGRDTTGGESGPDLTRSKLVASDVNGDKISDVVRNGRTNGDKKMPAFNFSSQELLSLAAFIHAQQIKANASNGHRKGVDVSDLQTGNVEAGKAYFNGAGGCSKCHSPTGDLAGIATKYEGLALEEHMLAPKPGKLPVTITLPSGKKIEGNLAYRDEFVIGIREADGTYRSWPTSNVKYTVEDRTQAHVALFPKYTDDDIHNLMAYIQTLR
jgi:cytochrome c oxidase cbb3-type subunit 3